jgi:putative aldouronate transport system substrate-binding protein
MGKKVSRRKFLGGLGTAAAAAAATACQPKTVIVERTVEVEKEKIVTQVVEVEREVTKIVAGTPVVEKVVETKVVTPTPIPTPTLAPGGWYVNYPPFNKYDPVKVFTHARGAGAAAKFIKGDSAEYHRGDAFSEEMTGIRFSPKIIYASGGEHREKLNLAMAANDLPDFFSSWPFDMYGQMVEAGLVKDITDLWEEHAPQAFKDIMAWGDGMLWEPLTVDGRIYGTPLCKWIGQDEKIQWFRRDWFDKVGATDPPTTLDELYEIMKAFVEAKVAGDDRPTIGLPINQDLNTWINSTDPIFGAYGVMPGYWKLMDDGSVVNYSVTEGAKEALALLNKWYQEGLVNQEFFTLEVGKSAELVMQGQVGLMYGPFWCGRWPQPQSIANEKAREIDAVWEMSEIPTGPAGRGTKFTLPVQGAHCANASMSDEDWIAALEHRIWVYQLTAHENLWETKWHGFENYAYRWTEDGCELVTEMESIGTPAMGFGHDVLGTEKEYQYKELLLSKYEEDPTQLDCYERALVEATYLAGEASERYQLVREAYVIGVDAAQNYAIGSDFNGAPTPTMIEEQGNLNAFEQAAYIDMIVGNKPIAEFDDFVQEWKDLGGQAIADEIAEYLASR